MKKVDERAAVSTTSRQSTQSGLTQPRHFWRSPCKSVHQLWLENSKSGDRPDLYAGALPPEVLKAIISIAASLSQEFSLMHVDVSCAYFRAKAPRPVLVKLPAEDCSGKDEGKIGLLKKGMYGARDAASKWERDWQALGRSSRNLFQYKNRKTSSLTHGDDLDQISRYRSHVARCLFLSQDRADKTFAVNGLCQGMPGLSQHSFSKLKRVVRYLKGERQWIQVFEFGDTSSEVTVFSYSDWAGVKETRKSSSVRVALVGRHPLEAQTRNQKKNRMQQHWERQKRRGFRA